jgi:outer membrane protein assembly factor BamE (lipoprotein component of BamABCDE complex)
MKRFLPTIAIITILGACTPTHVTRGSFLIAEDVQTIQNGITTQFDVLNLLGTPTSKAVFDESVWYYVGLKTEKESFFDEKVTDRQVYKITFNDAKIVQAVDLAEGNALDVPLATRVTPTSGNEITFLQQVLGNIGKYTGSK